MARTSCMGEGEMKMTYVVRPKGRNSQVLLVIGDEHGMPIALFYSLPLSSAGRVRAERYVQQLNEEIKEATKRDHG